MKLEPSAEDAAFLNRLFGGRIPNDDTTIRPALEWCAHCDMPLESIPDEDAWERCGKPMVGNLVNYCIWNGVKPIIVGWSLEEVDGFAVLALMVMKQREAKAA